MDEKISKASTAPSVVKILTTSLANWIENKSRPDSISTNMIDRNVVPPVAPNITLLCRNFMKILNTINPVARAFTVIVIPRLARTRSLPHAGSERPACA